MTAPSRWSGLGLVVCLALLAPGLILPAAAQTSDADTLTFLIARARKHPSLHGPTVGTLAMDGQQTPLATAGVDLRDFYARAAFTTPAAGADQIWDVGFVFRRAGAGSDEAFRFIVDADGAWYFKEDLQPTIAMGHVDGLARGAGGITRIDLAAIGDVGAVAINGGYVATLDLTARAVRGDVGVGTGFFTEDTIVGEQTAYAEFEVWAL
jgi:hypothetical protein